MSAIDDLTAQVQEPRLWEQLKREWAEAQKTKKFGLVFDRHLPGFVPMQTNRQRKWSGHLWQGRFFSSPLDESYLWFCVPYVGRNPVRAGVVGRAEDYPWSSAAGHCGLRKDELTEKDSVHWKMFEGVTDWAEWLTESDDGERLGIVRRNIQKNLPCGSEGFIKRLEQLAAQALRFRPIGRPKKRVASPLHKKKGSVPFAQKKG